MCRGIFKFLLTALLPLLVQSTLYAAVGNGDEIETAWETLIAELSGSAQARPLGGADELLLWVDNGEGGVNSLTALVEQAGQAALKRPGLFAEVVPARSLFSGAADLSQQGLTELDRRGFDRLLKIDVRSSSGAVVIKARVWWLDCDIWSVMAGQPYYSRQAETRLPASPLWGMLETRELNFGPGAPAWKERGLFSGKGRILDIAAADLDGDAAAELVLLFEERLEVWRRSGDDEFSFRHMQNLPQEELTLPARYAVGNLFFCGVSGASPLLLLAHNRLPGGLALQWSGADFAVTRRTERAPLACLPSASGGEGALLSSVYVGGGTAFAGRIYTDGSGLRREYKLPESFVAFEASPAAADLRDIYVVSPGGAVFDALGGKIMPSGSCGTQPALASGPAGENVLACGAARFGAEEEGMNITAAATGTKNAPVGFTAAAKGEVTAICAAPGEGLRFYVARYDAGSDNSRIVLLYP